MVITGGGDKNEKSTNLNCPQMSCHDRKKQKNALDEKDIDEKWVNIHCKHACELQSCSFVLTRSATSVNDEISQMFFYSVQDEIATVHEGMVQYAVVRTRCHFFVLFSVIRISVLRTKQAAS